MTYWLSTEKMTVLVETDSTGIITTTPPIVSKFKGQHIDNLRRWMAKQSGFKWEIISYK